MNNTEVITMKEFRRFATAHIYNDSCYILMNLIQNKLGSDIIEFEPIPKQVIKFNDNVIKNNCSQLDYNNNICTTLKSIFVEYFNFPEVERLIRNKIYKCVLDKDIKLLLYNALLELQSGNTNYISLLFNVTQLNDIIYLYL